MKLIIQKISILLFAFVPVLFVAAALAPKGEVPQVEPLQPLPQFVKPNIEQNVSRNTEDVGENESSSNENINTNIPDNGVGNIDSHDVSTSDVENPTAITADEPQPLSNRSQNLLLGVVVGGVVIALVLVFLGIRHHYKNQKKS